MINIYKKTQNAQFSLINSFLNNEESRNKSPKTLINYRADLAQFFDWLIATDRELSMITPGDISEYGRYISGHTLPSKAKSYGFINFWRKQIFKWIKPRPNHPAPRLLSGPQLFQLRSPLKASSRRRHFTALKMFFQFLIESEQKETLRIKKNPVMAALHSIKLKDIDIDHTKNISPEEFSKLLLKNKSVKSQFILNLLYFGGLRLAELCSLQVDSFDKSKQTIKLLRKGGSIQFLKVQNADLIFELFHKYCYSFHINQGWLFFDRFSNVASKKHITERSMYGVIKRMIKKGLPESVGIGPHSFRKACASELYKKTKDLLLVRNYLNHKDAKVTQSYIDYVEHQS
ncbi:MAG: site-specific integrase [Bacteriovoracaceae bacterium]|nr:site-specific integrase [Bacteriovoracaceae bacterium]